MRRFPLVTLALAALALLAAALPPAFTDALQFDRDAIARGELWRFLTAHLTHFGVSHLRWDVFALLLLGTMAEGKSRRDWLAALAVSAPAITLLVWALQPHFTHYRGLSGLDCAAYGVIVGHLFRDGLRARHHFTLALAVLAFAAALAKCAYELATGTAFFVGATTAFAPVPLAHLAGVLTGALVTMTPFLRQPATRRRDGTVQSATASRAPGSP
ncbi:rhombosortase [Termitidicoccus mucosus]